jgi:hypothetical protein
MYGTGNYEKCADCMVHSGFEATAVMDTVTHPLKAFKVSRNGPKTTGAFAKDIPLDKQRPAEYVFSRHVEIKELTADRDTCAGAIAKGWRPAFFLPCDRPLDRLIRHRSKKRGRSRPGRRAIHGIVRR